MTSTAGDVKNDRYRSLPGSKMPNSVGLLVWYLLGRAFIVTLFLGGSIFVSQVYPGETLLVPDLRLLVLLSVTFLQICFSLLWLLRWPSYLRYFVQLQISWDLVLSFLVVYITGGSASLFPFLFIFVIISCALISSRKQLYSTVLAAIVLYAGLVGLQYYAYLPFVHDPDVMSDKEIIYRLFLNVVAFLLAGTLGSILASRLQRSEQLLQRERHDYAELEQLNSVILHSITSGLIVVDSSEAIRAFNSAAAVICSMPASVAYNKKLSDILPNLVIDQSALPIERAEFDFVTALGEQRVIGYNATKIHDEKSALLRILITFQDLTEAKALEHNLQLGARLAAIGKLAAGLAHEIRNPLASLGGSIQLLSESLDSDVAEQELFDIAQRETERLNRLVSDFLVFAKPQLPVLRVGDLVEVVREVLVLAKADPLFSEVQVQTQLPDSFSLTMDAGQMHQALWNLLVNAAQFAQEPKQILVAIDSDKQMLWIDDNGFGISSEDKKQIFEPFYTSRPQGTGLGLSIVHGIVSAHGWLVDCSENEWGGARMQIVFGRSYKN